MHGSPPYHLTDIVMDLTVKMHLPDLFMGAILYYSADLFHNNTCLYFIIWYIFSFIEYIKYMSL